MGEFVCRVADGDGRVFSHVEAASSLDEARQKLADRGLYVYSVESRGGRLAALVRRRGGRQIGGSDFLILNQQFNTLIKAGLPILRALDLLANRAASPKLRPVISQIRDRVREGKSLSEAVAEAGVFSKVYSTAILAGEKSGNLPGVLDYYIAYQRVSTGVRKKNSGRARLPHTADQRCDRDRDLPCHGGHPKVRHALPGFERRTPCAHAVVDRRDHRLPFCSFGNRRVDGRGCRGSFFVVPHGTGRNGFRPFQVPCAGAWRHPPQVSSGTVFAHTFDAAYGGHPSGRWAPDCK